MNAEILNVLVEREIDDDNIIVVTSKGDRLLLSKWTMKLSPLSFEGKVFLSDISPMWVKMYIEDKGEMKWSIEKHLASVQFKEKSNIKSQYNEYKIEVSDNNELFIINGEKFKAKTYCLGWDMGDKIQFIEGSAMGVCTSAKLLNINRNSICEVWCE